MKRERMILKSILGCFILLFAFSMNAYAMNFDVEEVYNSIFVLYSGNSQGSGFAIGKNTVITNAHVISNEYDILLYSYEGNAYRASVYLMDENFDIAVLGVENADFVPLEIGDYDEVKIGDDIYAIGAPKSMGYTLTKGIISNKKRTIGDYDYIQIDAAINSGNSGGPLLNENGQVIGVNSMKISDAEGIGLAIPSASVMSFIENNGMALTDDYVIEGEIPFVDGLLDDRNGTEIKDNLYEAKPQYNFEVLILSVCLFISVMFNISFIIFWIYRKNKNKDYMPDRSERIDFDIDILG